MDDARGTTSLPPKRPPAPSLTGFTSSYNVPSANNFIEPEQKLIEEKIFEEFQSPRPSGTNNAAAAGTLAIEAGYDYPPDDQPPVPSVMKSNPIAENSLHGIQRDNPWDENFQPKAQQSQQSQQPVMPARTYKTPEIDPFKVDW